MRNPNDVLIEAIKQQYSIIPIGYDKNPCFNWLGYTERVAKAAEIKTWRYTANVSAYALICGKISGLFTLDLDNRNTLTKFNIQPHTMTPSGGLHIYVKPPQGVEIPKISQSNPWLMENYPELDIQGERSYAIFVGKVRTGQYINCRPLADLALFEDLPADLQEFILTAREKLKNQGEMSVQPLHPNAALSEVELSEWVFRALSRVATDGNRDNVCFWLCCQLRDLLYNYGYSEEEAKKIISVQLQDFVDGCPKTNSKGIHDPFTMGQALRKLESVYTKAARQIANGGSNE